MGLLGTDLEKPDLGFRLTGPGMGHFAYIGMSTVSLGDHHMLTITR